MALLLIVLALHPVSQEGRLPVPEASAQRQAETLVREIFKDDYAKKAPADRRALALKLLQQASETSDDAAARYVLLRESQDLAAQTGDDDTAFQAIDALAKHYAVSGPELKLAALASIEKSARSPEECRRVSLAYLKVGEDVLPAGSFEAAERSCESAVSWARKGKDVPLLSRAEARLKEVKELRARHAGAAGAEKILASNPEDPPANATVGLFKCLVLGEWEKGLPLVAKGPDGPFKAAAQKDLAAPSDPAAGVAVGDAWWDLGEKETGVARISLRKRAATWYAKAVPGLTGLTKVRAEKRVVDVTGQPPGIDLLKIVDPEKDSVKGVWSIVAGALHSPPTVPHAHVELAYIPPEEYDLQLVVERLSGIGSLDVGLILDQKPFLLVVDGYAEVVTGLDTLDRKPANANETTYRAQVLPRGRTVTLRCSVRKNGIDVTVDGKSILSWKGTSARLGMPGAYRLRDRSVLFLGAYTVDMKISQATLHPVTGSGRTTR